MYTELKNKGLELIAVNPFDSKDVIRKYVDENKWSFLIGMGKEGQTDYGISKKYGVSAYPTNYLLDGDGKVVFRSIGFNEKGIREALEKLGVK